MDAERPTRRELLALVGAGAGAALAGCSLPGGDGGNATTTPVADERARELAERLAPTLYFDADETWFPTDPRPYASERDGERVVHGFDAVEGYLEGFEQGDSPTVPAPTVFYNAVRYDGSPLEAVQFWCYSAFDQFTTNFHWHDWEVIHVFVDAGTDDPQLYVASSHSRRVPNNEFLDPESPPVVLSELGSHSSALSVNERVETFQRLPLEDTAADVTNAGVDIVEALAEFPLAYGLPRDEGFRLPYVVPELDGEPVYDHPELPTFERSHLVPRDLTVRSYDALDAPPENLPARETGTTFGSGDADVTYDLVSTIAVEDIDAFVGPQLSFEFAIPKFLEDAVASHLTTASTPWTQARYADPAADITDPNHRAAMADRYDAVSAGGAASRVVGLVRDVVPEEDAPDGGGVTPVAPLVEAVALLESDPAAVPSFAGVVAAEAEPGDHRLTVNGAGRKPYSERLRVGDKAVATAGAGGRIALVANADAAKLRVDAEGTDADLRRVAVADDFAGALYETRVDGADAVYVHRAGAYTTEVEDADGALGAFRTNPGPDAEALTVERPDTGKASLASFVADLATETRDDVRAETDGGGTAGDPAEGLATALDAVATAAKRAAERARAADAAGADKRLRAVRRRLEKVREALATVQEAGAIPAPLARAVDRRLSGLDRRTAQALEATKL